MKVIILALAIFSLNGVVCMAADQVATATPAMSTSTEVHIQEISKPTDQTAGDKIAAKMTDVADAIPLSGLVITILMGVYDFIRRRFPTKNPASLLRDVQKIFRAISGLFGKLDQFLDKILGQTTKNEQPADTENKAA